ncbi:MAG: LacI family DNA-binding transcriptional regulator [Oceanipulchritudo sp.]
MKPRRASRKHVSYKDIAEEAKVSQMTVSLAFRNHPSIPPATRKRIRNIADRLGYVPDPKMAQFLQYMRGRRQSRDFPVLAYLHVGDGRLPPRNSYNGRLLEGARERAAALGYRVEPFWLNPKGLNETTFARVLRTRAIDGLLIPPLPVEMGCLELPWDSFSVVTASYTSDYLGFNQICNNRHQITQLALEEARKRGYKRIGLVVNKELDIRSSHNTLSYFYWFQSQQPECERVPVLYETEIAKRQFFKWLNDNRVDVVVSGLNLLYFWLKEAKVAIPADLGFISLSTYEANRDGLSGVDECAEQVGSASVDLLTSQMNRNETGVPEVRKLILLEGTWVEGATVRRRS